MKKFLVPYLMSLAAFVTVFLFGSFGKTPDFARGAQVPNGTAAFQEVRAIKMPSSLDFCGEAVPLDRKSVV